MIKGLWGTKIGMTQAFSDNNKVVPVTVINTSHWLITGLKTKERDGYNAIQVGRLRKRYEGTEFDAAWLKHIKKYFINVREIKLDGTEIPDIQLGQKLDLASIIEKGVYVDVFGKTKGRGFQGVIKRHGFSGGPASHGSNFHRSAGSIGFFCSEGRVPKGQKMAGHMGACNDAILGLEVIQVNPDANIVLVKGSVPGTAGSLVFMRKQNG